MPTIERTVSTRLYPDQVGVWDRLRNGQTDADKLREVIKFYCDQHGLEFPMYETFGRGGKRRGKGKVEARPIE